MDDKDSVVIDIRNSASASKKYLCSYCNTRLIPLTREDMIGCYVCTKCTIQYWPDQQPVKKQSKFELPGPNTDEHGNVVGDIGIPSLALKILIESYLQPHLGIRNYQQPIKH